MVYAHGPIRNLTIRNNVGLNMMATCIQLENQNSDDNLDGLTVTNNYCGNTGTASNDVGALHLRLYAGVNTPTAATDAVISNNYFRDCGGVTAGRTAEPGSSKCIYMDDLTSGVTLTGNVMAGHFTYGAFIAHGAHDNTWTGNIVDLGDGADGLQHIGMYQSSTACTTGASCMVKNEWHDNIVIANNSVAKDGNYELLNQGNYTAPTLANDLAYEYGSGSIEDSASVSSANPEFSTLGLGLCAGD